ncbi:MAG: hypothetical protein AAF960_08715 [Bacteroidota bacterium]
MDNLSAEDRDLTKRFLDRQLSKEELNQVNKRLENDPDFAQAMAFQSALREAFAKRIADTKEKENETTVVPLRGHRRWLGSVAVAAVTLGLLVFWWTYQPSDARAIESIRPIALETFREKMEPRDLLATSVQIEQLIQQKNYDRAYQLLTAKSAAAITPCKNNRTNFQLGMLQLYQQPLSNVAKAVTPLRCIYDNYLANYPDIPIHLARAYLWSNQIDKAQIIIETTTVPLPPDLQSLRD